MKEMKRILSLVLCLVMLVGLIPAGALSVRADDAPNAVVVAASDFQQNDGHRVSDSVMENIINAMTGAGYTDVDGAIFCGDYSNQMTAKDSNEGLSYVYGNYNGTWGLDYDDIVFVQGNHDPADTSYLAPSGENDPDSGAYGVFVINEDDYGWASGDYGKSEDEIKDTADNLKTYLDAKIEAKFDAPIFVASHLPLHYSMRTYNDGDCRYAQYIFDVLNDASEAGLNIIYLYGHNHSQSFENYHGGGAVFYSAGDKILISDTTNNKTHHTETIQFTYLNAGYTGRFDSTDTADPTNTGTVYEIYDDEVVIRRFDAKGTHNLKSAGVQSQEYSTEASLYGINDRVEESPQTIKLKQFVPDATEKDGSTGITVTAPGVTGVTVTVKTPTYDTEKYTAYASYDIELTGYTQGNTATVTIPAPAGFDASKPAVVLYDGKQIAKDTDLSDGITFTTNHFSTYAVAQLAESNVENWVEIPGESTDIFRLTDSLTAGKKYVIVSSNAAGNANAVNLNSNNINSTSVTIIADSEGNYIVAPATTAQWTYNSSSKFQSVNTTNRYLRGRNSNNTLRTTTDSGDSYTSWTYSKDYGLQCTDGRYIPSSITGDMVNASTTNRVYIFKEDVITIVGGYAGMTGQTNYSVVTGRYADQAAVVNMIKGNITVYFATEDDYTDANATTDYQITGTVTPGTAGTYTLTVTYEGQTLGTITVNVSDKTATNIEVDPMEGSVERGSKNSAETGSTMTVTYDDGTSETIPVTVSMLSGTYDVSKNGTYTGLTITYAGKTVENYTLNVVNVSGNDFPSYPEGGSVKVTKTGEGQDFQNTGVARVSLSTSGLPSKKGVDVIVMLDTSSSMTSNNVDNGSQTRAAALCESLANLVGQLQANGPDGEPMDIKIAIADFNGYYVSDTNTTQPYNLETKDHLKGTTVKSTTTNFGAEIYTGTRNLTAGAFVDVHDINGQTVANALNFQSGTNYDYAFDAVYQLGTAIKEANEEERDLYVVFMSDGGPFQYNYFSTQSEANNGGDLWNHWMTGNVVDSDWDDTTHSYFYNPEGKHWMAEAIKGDPSQNYTVIRKNATEFIDVTGDGVADKYMTQVRGLGATMYSIGFCAEKDDNAIKAASIQYVLKNIASNESLYHTANDGDDLNGIFSAIASDIRYAAQNAVFMDQMGDDYNLQMNPTIKTNNPDFDGTTTTISTDITVKEYPIYTKAQIGTEVNGHTVTADDVGKTYGNGTVLETVKFTSDTAATSTALPNETNIIKEGVICAKNFFYNTASTPKTITLANGSTYELPGETFYWNIGTINEKQFTLSYAVYLTGSMEGTRAEGSYDTNNYATLYYTNWLGNDVEQSVKSPTMPWGGANVSYAFYLVNDQGKPVDANGNVVPNIVTAYKVTLPVLYKTINLNSGETVLSTVADDVLPDGYTLYDEKAVYTVTVNSGNGGGSWEIEGTYPTSTYVTNHAGENEYSNATPVSDATYDYTHTTVYFAVVWTIGTVPDTVVIDYGLPVDIDVMFNDMFGNYGTLAGVGESEGERREMTGFDDTYTGTYGTAELKNGKVRYTPENMEMNGYEQFYYAVYYTDNSVYDDSDAPTQTGYYYGTVTVIPATTIYYEDNFLTYTASGTKWVDEGTAISDATQAEDRPGQYSLTDANNIYGYDGINLGTSTFSLGTAKKVHVDADSYATASFTFYGTGFDIISMTSNTTGTITVQVTAAENITKADGSVIAANTVVKSAVVNTYYGYKYEQLKDENGNPKVDENGDAVYGWVSYPDDDKAMYQVPVMQIEELAYGKYNVVIKATYATSLDKTTDEGYDLYLDAIRIYDPANDGAVDNDTVIEDAYIADGEGWPSYIELRNKLIDTKTLGNADTDTKITGLVFIDGDDEVGDAQISDYISYGPNNEVYLAPGQRVAFILSTPDNIANVHIGIKSADGKTGTYTITNIAKQDIVDSSTTKVKAGDYYNANTNTISTTTDMYYDLTGYKGDIIVISNTGDRYKTDGIISLTNIKSTYTTAPVSGATTVSDDLNDGLMTASEEELTETYIYMTRAASTLTLRSLNSAAQEEVPEETEPETTVPEETEPETTVPEETEPETTIPEETEPETSEPGSGAGSANNSIIGTIIKIVLGWLFG